MNTNPDISISALPDQELFNKPELGQYRKVLNSKWQKIHDLLSQFHDTRKEAELNSAVNDFISELRKTIYLMRCSSLDTQSPQALLFANNASTALTGLYETFGLYGVNKNFTQDIKSNISLKICLGKSSDEEIVQEIVSLMIPTPTLPIQDRIHHVAKELNQRNSTFRPPNINHPRPNEEDGETLHGICGKKRVDTLSPPVTRRGMGQGPDHEPEEKKRTAVDTRPPSTRPQPQQILLTPDQPAANENAENKNPETENPPQNEPITRQRSKFRRNLGLAAFGGALLAAGLGLKASYQTSQNETDCASVPTFNSFSPIPTQPPRHELNPAPAPVNQHQVENIEQIKAYRFDRNSEKFRNVKKFFHSRGMYAFESALEEAARNTRLEKKGNLAPTRLETYQAFLETGLKLYSKPGAIHDYFKVNKKALDRVLAANPYNGIDDIFDKSNFESRFLSSAVSDPLLVDENIAGCAVNTNPVENHNYSRWTAIGGKSFSGYFNIADAVIRSTATEPCACDNMHQCIFDRIDEQAEKAMRKDKNNGTKFVNSAFRRQYNEGIPNIITDVLKNTYEMRKSDVQKPIDVTSLPEIRDNSQPGPAHSFNDDDQDWFEIGEKQSQENIRTEQKNRKFVAAYPEWFPEEPKPEKPGVFRRALDFLKKTISGEKSPEETEQKQLRAGIPKKGLLQSLIFG